MKRFLILFLPFIINSQVIQTNDTIVLDEVSVKILRESNKEELSIYSISKIDLDINWFKSQENLNLTYNLLGVLILYFLIYKFDEIAGRRVKQKVSPVIKKFIISKKIISLSLLPILIIMFTHSFLNWILTTLFSYSISSSEFIDINSIFYNEFFTLLILADAFILLISFRYTERYSQLIRNTGFIISTILIRLSFGTTGLTNVALIISSILFGLLILRIYNEYEKV